MTDDLERLERDIRARLERLKPGAKRAPGSSSALGRSLGRLDRDLAVSKSTRNRHLRLLGDTSREGMGAALGGLKSMMRSGETVKGLREVLADSVSSFNAFVSAMETVVADLKSDRDAARREVRALKAELGHESEKVAQRKAAARLAGAVRIVGASPGSLRAEVDGHEVLREGKAWSCDCPARGECDHVRSVQLVSIKSSVRPVSGVQTAAGLVASGAVTIRSYENFKSAFAEVVDVDRDEVCTISGVGGAAISCSCGSWNGKCLHGDAVRLLTRRPS